MPPTSRKNARYFKNKVRRRLHFRPFGVRYHGKHCGPLYSNGRWQPSVCGGRGVDAFDETCRDHDCRRHHGINRELADRKFAKANWGKGIKRSLAAAAVYADGYLSGEWNFSSEKNEIMSHHYSTPRKDVHMREAAGSSLSIMNAGTQTTGGGKTKGMSGKVVFRGGSMPRLEKKKHMRRGCVNELETNAIMTSSRTGYVGHITFPAERMGLTMARAIVRGVYQEMSVDFTDWDQNVPSFGTANEERFIFSYYVSYTSTTILTINVLALTTFKALADDIWTGLKAIYQAHRNPRFLDLEFKYVTAIDIDPGAPIVLAKTDAPGLRVDLQGTKFEFDVQSVLKMQNVTVPQTTGTGEDELTTNVEAVPLYFAMYEGKGTGTTLKVTSQVVAGTPFVGDRVDGNILVSAASAPNDSLFEMPEKSGFTSVKHLKRGIFHPGEIMTSVLGYHKKYSFQALAPLFNNTFTELYQYMHTGTFQFYGFDKVLQQVGDNNNIVVQTECQKTFCCTMHMAKKQAILSINDTI